MSNDLASKGFCNPREIFLRACHIQCCLNVIADSLSNRDKVAQTEWSILQMICQLWHRPMVDMFVTKLNNKLPLHVSPVSDPIAMAVDALSIEWEALNSYAHCPIALILKLVQKMRTCAWQMIVSITRVARVELVLGPDRPIHKPTSTASNSLLCPQ